MHPGDLFCGVRIGLVKLRLRLSSIKDTFRWVDIRWVALHEAYDSLCGLMVLSTRAQLKLPWGYPAASYPPGTVLDSMFNRS